MVRVGCSWFFLWPIQDLPNCEDIKKNKESCVLWEDVLMCGFSHAGNLHLSFEKKLLVDSNYHLLVDSINPMGGYASKC